MVMNVSIIIPNYNGEKILSQNLSFVLDAVKDYSHGNVEIIIPDDPSTDNSKVVIQNFIAGIKEKHIIGKTVENKNKSNAGFSKNVNRGVSIATGDILILLNSDVAPHKNFLKPLLSHFTNPKVFAVGCLDESIENGKVVPRGRGIGRWSRGFLTHSEGKLDKQNTLWVSCGSGAFRRSIWDDLGGLDELFNPFYWEDIDISYRALKGGYETLFEHLSIVTHNHELGAIKTKYKSAYIRKIAYRNQFMFIWKNITQTSLLLSHIVWLPYHLIKAIARHDWEFISGFILAFVRIPQVIQSKYLSKVENIRTDRDILKNVEQ